MFGWGKVTTGASNDIAQATEIARKMVTEWGMSELLGPLRYNENQEEIFLGHSVSQQKNVSDATAEVIDQEVRSIVDDAEEQCRKILTERNDDLHKLAKGLLEYETLDANEVQDLLKGRKIHRDDPGDSSNQPPRKAGSVPTTDGSEPKESKSGGFGPEPQPEG